MDVKIPIIGAITAIATIAIVLILAFSPMKTVTSEIYSGSDFPEGFAINYSFGTGEGNLLDTERKVYVHDMVCESPISITFRLSDEQLRTIWKSAEENDFFTIRNVTTDNPITPMYSSTLTIKASNESHTVRFTMDPFLLDRSDVQRFRNITQTIDGILKNDEQIKDLPQPPCAYQ